MLLTIFDHETGEALGELTLCLPDPPTGDPIPDGEVIALLIGRQLLEGSPDDYALETRGEDGALVVLLRSSGEPLLVLEECADSADTEPLGEGPLTPHPDRDDDFPDDDD